MTETQAIQRCQTGDRHAFRQLVHRYQHVLYRTAALITGNQAHAERQVRDTFRLAWRSIHAFNLARPLQPWLIRILLRQDMSDYPDSAPSTASASDQNTPPQIPSPLPPGQTLYEHRAMRRAFAGLQPDHRNVLVLRYFADLQGTDLVLALDTPEDQVESLRRQALSQLCQRLKVAAAHNPKAVAPLVASNRALIQALRNHLTATASALNVPPNLWDIPTSPVARPSRLDRLRHKLRTAAMRCGIPVSAATVTSPRRRPPPHS